MPSGRLFVPLICLAVLSACRDQPSSPALEPRLVATQASPSTLVRVEFPWRGPLGRHQSLTILTADGVETSVARGQHAALRVDPKRPSRLIVVTTSGQVTAEAWIGEAELRRGAIMLTPQYGGEAYVLRHPLYTPRTHDQLRAFREIVLDSTTLRSLGAPEETAWAAGEFDPMSGQRPRGLAAERMRTLMDSTTARASRLLDGPSTQAAPPGAPVAAVAATPVAGRHCAAATSSPPFVAVAPAVEQYCVGVTGGAQRRVAALEIAADQSAGYGRRIELWSGTTRRAIVTIPTQEPSPADWSPLLRMITRAPYVPPIVRATLPVPDDAVQNAWAGTAPLRVRMVQASFALRGDLDAAADAQALAAEWTVRHVMPMVDEILDGASDASPVGGSGSCTQAAEQAASAVVIESLRSRQPPTDPASVLGDMLDAAINAAKSCLDRQPSVVAVRWKKAGIRLLSGVLKISDRATAVLLGARFLGMAAQPSTAWWSVDGEWLDGVTVSGPAGAPQPARVDVGQPVAYEVTYRFKGMALPRTPRYASVAAGPAGIGVGTIRGDARTGTITGRALGQMHVEAVVMMTDGGYERFPGRAIEVGRCLPIELTRVQTQFGTDRFTTVLDTVRFQAWGRPSAACDPQQREVPVPSEQVTWEAVMASPSGTATLHPVREGGRLVGMAVSGPVTRWTVTGSFRPDPMGPIASRRSLSLTNLPGSLQIISHPTQLVLGSAAFATAQYRDANGAARSIALCLSRFGAPRVLRQCPDTPTVAILGINTFYMYARDVNEIFSSQFVIRGVRP